MMTSNNGDDYMDTKSCIDFQNNHSGIWKATITASKSSSMKRKEKKMFPPSIPQTAWVLRRYYTSDGRLILKEEKMKHHGCFQRHRDNGRLTMHLVHLDQEASQEEEVAPTIPVEIDSISLIDEGHESSIIENDKGVSSSNWLNCNRVRSSPSSCASAFGVPLHLVRTVQG
ncbi:hypothetical protein VNO78_01418 [Psophocarpus tetragonolobus]|uniref:FAF domain-containing protein n=1 Tax=Psophocarpus tetragonolobus TaxID=3891 RepID=A0AAN9SXY4_PSOTE